MIKYYLWGITSGDGVRGCEIMWIMLWSIFLRLMTGRGDIEWAFQWDIFGNKTQWLGLSQNCHIFNVLPRRYHNFQRKFSLFCLQLLSSSIPTEGIIFNGIFRIFLIYPFYAFTRGHTLSLTQNTTHQFSGLSIYLIKSI